MKYFVFRNNTVERFFPKEFDFSGYDDISSIPSEYNGYIWFYQIPIKFNITLLSDEITSYQQKLEYLIQKISPEKIIIAFTIAKTYEFSYSGDDKRLSTAINGYNQKLFELELKYSNLKVLNISEFYDQFPINELIDWKFYFISQMGINPRLTRQFSIWFEKKLNGIALKRKKCLVLDLDNTLWGGVLGEDGVSGIQIGGDYPGKAFLYWQEALLELSKQGIILTICSKNNERDVLEAWEKNPFIILKKEHFSSYRINWNNKASNIQEIASELNIGLDSIVFIDDNPFERELVKQALPMVSVPEFPQNPYELPKFFSQILDSYFTVYSITNEDKNKIEQYQANANRAKEATKFDNYGDFLESLNIKISIEKANPQNIPRISQMTQKTNQFNLTTKRYTESDILNFLNEGWKIWCINVEDRFGDSGITGCIIINDDEIDSFLLSCRILGKGIEEVFLKSILSILSRSGLNNLKASYFPTIKNSQVKNFWDNMNFECTKIDTCGNKFYKVDLNNVDLKIKNIYKIKIK